MSAKNYTIRKGYTFFKGNKSLPHGSGVHTLTDQDIEGQAWKVEEVFPKTVAQKAAEDKVVEDARIKAEEDAQAKANLKAAQKEAARLDEEAAIAEENERQRIQDEAEEEAKVNAAVDETDADGQP
ncbi:MAG: hypothetical protein KAR06_11005, partial [Deltaproteobacteria bacterium]|nr:hypothetical protein [Deltaproteobacteria bacterium]